MSRDPASRDVVRRTRERAVVVVTLAAALAVPAPARARACASIAGDGPAPGEAQVQGRAEFLRERLLAARPRARTWTLAWGVADAALAVGQLAGLPSARSRSSRALLGAGAAASALGILPLVLFPIVPLAPPPAADKCAELATLEDTVARAARNQRLGAGALAQTGNVLVNAGFGIAAALAGGWRAGAAAAVIGWSLGEAQLLTQPTALVDDLARDRGPHLALPPTAGSRTRPSRVAVLALALAY